MPQALTANRLKIGEVVYWSGKTWVSRFEDAQILSDADAGAWVLKGEVVAPYLFDIREKDGHMVPVKEREIIRSAGPTVRRDLGKQAG
jgi:hypothetical protein